MVNIDWLIGVVLFMAACEDLYHGKVFDGYAIIIAVISLCSAQPSATQILACCVSIGLSFWPLRQPCWGLGDGLLIGALALLYPPKVLACLLAGSTILLGAVALGLADPWRPLPLVPGLWGAWLGIYIIESRVFELQTLYEQCSVAPF